MATALMAEKSTGGPSSAVGRVHWAAAQATSALGSSSETTAAVSTSQMTPPNSDPQHTADIAPLTLSAAYQGSEANDPEDFTAPMPAASKKRGKAPVTKRNSQNMSSELNPVLPESSKEAIGQRRSGRVVRGKQRQV